MHVHQFWRDQEFRFETRIQPPAFTDQKRSRRLHIPGRQLAKCVLLAEGKRFLLAVLPATHHVDLERLTVLLEQPVRLATDEEVAAVFRDCEWGVSMPFGSLYGIP